MNKTKDCLPDPIDGFIHLDPNVSHRCGQVLPVGVKIKAPTKEQIAEYITESSEIEKALKAKSIKV